MKNNILCINFGPQYLNLLLDCESNLNFCNYSDLVIIESKDMDDAFLLLFLIDKNIEGQLISLRGFKETSPFLPVIIITTEHIPFISLWCLRNKMLDYIVLPKERVYFNNSVNFCYNLVVTNSLIPRKPFFNELGQQLGRIVIFDKNAGLKTQRAIDVINDAFFRVIRISELAKVCNMSEWTFSDCFKKEHGITPVDYINIRRISEACILLQNTSFNAQQVAYKVGFDDASYFNKVFKSTTGKTPLQYRRGGGHVIREQSSAG